MDAAPTQKKSDGASDTAILDKCGYQASFRILVQDLERVTEFIEPTKNNGNTYSHRLYELLLRACTDFESICRDSLESEHCAKKRDKMTIKDYETLERSLRLSEVDVALHRMWVPAPLLIQPFEAWATDNPSPLPWYQAYNAVKHNRRNEFQQANLNNCVLAIAGFFAVLATLKVLQPVSEDGYRLAEYMEWTYYPYPFSLRRPVRTIVGSTPG
jgi:hypothetical protein